MNFNNKILESFAPYIVSLLVEGDEQKKFVIRVGELCEKHNVSFISFMNIVMELAKQEATR